MALGEMFPNSVRNATGMSISFVKGSIRFVRKSVWVVTTSSLLLILPALYEREVDRALEEHEISQNEQHSHLVSHLV